MSHERQMKWLNDKRIIYRKDPVNDMPTISTKEYNYYEDGTHEYYSLFNTQSKITTYKSLKWHMLVLYYLNMDNIINSDFVTIARFIANKDNGFVTFFIKNKLLEDMIRDVLIQGGDPPINKKRRIIFKDYNGLSFDEKMKIVGKLIGRQKLSKEKIYSMMLEINDMNRKISLQYLADLLRCSVRTLHRNMGEKLKQEKQKLNEKI
tara:strand:+ start:2021 stop:2638 length:618 start_codon:yes stop_codon:yes gene_type:complete